MNGLTVFYHFISDNFFFLLLSAIEIGAWITNMLNAVLKKITGNDSIIT